MNYEDYNRSPVTAATLEKLTNVSYRTIKRRISNLKPVMTDDKSNYYDPWEALPLIYEQPHGESSLDLNQERARLANIQARKTELEVAKMESSLISAKEAEALWAKVILVIRSKLLNFPSRYSMTLASCTETYEVERNLKDAVYEILTEIAGIDVSAIDNAKSPEVSEPATPTDSEQVG